MIGRAAGRRLAWGVALVVAVTLLAWGARRVVRTASSAAHGRVDDGTSSVSPSAAAGVQGRSNDSAARRVRATIVDDDGEPLEGGHVSLRCLFEDEVTPVAGNAWSLDESGSFDGPGCLGVVCVDLHHVTAIPADAWVLTPGEPQILRATTLPRLYGTVVDRRGRPIPAARVSVRAPNDGEPELLLPTIGGTTTTDIDGVFSFALVRRPPCDPCTEADRGCEAAPPAMHDQVLLAVHAPGFAPTRRVVDVDPEHDVDVSELRMVPPADVLSGTLVDPRGDAYPRATVIARASDDPSEQHEATPEGDSFEFESLGAGPYDLRALQDGVELATAARIVPGDDVELRGRVIARGPHVALEVTDGGTPLAGVAVDGGPFRGARTDPNGMIEADLAMPGQYTLSLRPPGAAPVRRAITIPAEPGARTDGPPRVQIRVELTGPSPR
ncbi:MAG: carboxypeptidase regulatory-like domain-containing protein [Myxococcales bacterium]|nr:carboxypeptidase regulatory-like domain-containing protein [Myxococcales bacterium]